MKRLMYAGLTALLPASLMAFPTYTGYSGAPGSYGHCASSCHGSGTGTITVTGFPSAYDPGQQYEIIITSPSAVKNFNGSIRQGTGSANAGTITAGTGTETYNVTGETNGVHLVTTDQTSFSFFWTAPAAGTGDVRLYLALHWGLAGGNNLDTVLVATENVGTDEQDGGSTAPVGIFPTQDPQRFLLRVQPVNRPRTVKVMDAAGLLRTTLLIPAGESEIVVDLSGMKAGIYFIGSETDFSFKITKR